ncbi:MAG TPA: hypothetical protein VGP16_09200 [Asanoa sp.]|nr:hypothetical protein [Asanoa sp.]
MIRRAPATGAHRRRPARAAPPPRAASWPATDSGSSAAATDIAAAFNGLDQWAPGAGEAPECLLGDRAEYQVLIGYADRPATTLFLSPGCGVVTGDGATRRIDALRPLLGLWG